LPPLSRRTFFSLRKLMHQLQSRKQEQKLVVYQSFTIVLVISLVAAAAFSVYSV
jgi:hypothetical protein